jgi:hypothetical protein
MANDQKLREAFFESQFDDFMSFDEFKEKVGNRDVREIDMSEMEVDRRSTGGSRMTDKQKKFAALAEPTDEITFADKIVGATKKNNKVRKAKDGAYGGGDYGGDEVIASSSCKGAGAAIRGTKFIGVR